MEIRKQEAAGSSRKQGGCVQIEALEVWNNDKDYSYAGLASLPSDLCPSLPYPP
jgi:hypothetical protein